MTNRKNLKLALIPAPARVAAIVSHIGVARDDAGAAGGIVYRQGRRGTAAPSLLRMAGTRSVLDGPAPNRTRVGEVRHSRFATVDDWPTASSASTRAGSSGTP